MAEAEFPRQLLDWTGDRAGGVKKLFYTGSGRPAGQVIETALLTRLARWADDVGQGRRGVPTVLLLVGGPGNGKTEGIEFTIRKLDAAMSLDGALVREFASLFAPEDGIPPRRAVAKRSRFDRAFSFDEIAIVQDASESEPGSSQLPAELFVADMEGLIGGPDARLYLACVNRGILDDALIIAEEKSDAETSALLKQVVRSVFSVSGCSEVLAPRRLRAICHLADGR